MTNNFLFNGDMFRAEEYNGAILVANSLSPLVTVELPGDYSDGLFHEGDYRTGMFRTNLMLNDAEIDNNGDKIHGSNGVAVFRVYPNFAPFKLLKKIEFQHKGPIMLDLKKDNGVTLLKSDVESGEDLSGLTVGLEVLDLVFTIASGWLSSVDITIQGGE